MNKQEIEKSIELLKRSTLLDAIYTTEEHDKALQMAISALTQQLNNGWISVDSELPEVNKNVQITFKEFMDWNKKYRFGTCKAIYIPDHSIKAEDMGWDNSDDLEVYDETEDTYYVKGGWYEVIEHWPDYTHVYIDCEVTAWQPQPEPYKEDNPCRQPMKS